MRNIFIILCVCFLTIIGNEYVYGQKTSPLAKFNPNDLAKSGIDLGKVLLKDSLNVIPSVDNIMSFGKNTIGGVPLKVGFQLINKACSAALSQKQVKPKVLPDVTKMNFMLKTCQDDIMIPIQTPEKLLDNLAFDVQKKTALLVTGWFSNVNSTMKNDALETVWKAYKCRNDMNFIALDAAAYVDSLYTWSAFNTDEIGKIVAKGFVEMLKKYPLKNIHLIGHSLGAHIVGAIGRYYTIFTNESLPRITGLDPASPCFNEGESLNSLSRGDAVFVDVIHSNSGVLGKKDFLGDVDFYPNGIDPLPPGCMEITCAHGRSWEFFAESVYPRNQNAFLATRCNSLSSLNAGKCPGKRIPMGFACPTDVRGNFFLNTKSSSPYGEHSLKESEIVCNEC